MKYEIQYEGLAQLFGGFIMWIMKACKEKNIQKIYFFTREGEFFKHIYDKLLESGADRDEYPAAHLLEVSRVATFAPSIQEVCIQEFQRIWSLYKKQSMRAFFASLDIDIKGFRPYLEDYGLPEEMVISNPQADKRVIAFLRDEYVKEMMIQSVAEKRENLIAYCEKNGIRQNAKGRIAVVDIGWRGTIQDNLCVIFPEIQWEGFYLCLAEFLNQQPFNGKKYGYLNQGNSAVALRYPTPIEMICNSPAGSVLGYNKDGEALRLADQCENRAYVSFTREFQTRIADKVSVKCFADMSESQILEHGERALNRFLLFPPRKAAQAYFSLKHNEMFGNGAFLNKQFKIKKKLFILACICEKSRRQLKQALYDTTWPQGYLTVSGMPWLVHLYNRMLERNYLI